MNNIVIPWVSPEGMKVLNNFLDIIWIDEWIYFFKSDDFDILFHRTYSLLEEAYMNSTLRNHPDVMAHIENICRDVIWNDYEEWEEDDNDYSNNDVCDNLELLKNHIKVFYL